MDYYAAHARGLAQTQTILGTACPVINWQGANYPVIPGTAARKKDAQMGGFEPDCDLVFDCLSSTFPGGSPTQQNRIGYLGNTYRVRSVGTKPGALILHFQCIDANQGS